MVGEQNKEVCPAKGDTHPRRGSCSEPGTMGPSVERFPEAQRCEGDVECLLRKEGSPSSDKCGHMTKVQMAIKMTQQVPTEIEDGHPHPPSHALLL